MLNSSSKYERHWVKSNCFSRIIEIVSFLDDSKAIEVSLNIGTTHRVEETPSTIPLRKKSFFYEDISEHLKTKEDLKSKVEIYEAFGMTDFFVVKLAVKTPDANTRLPKELAKFMNVTEFLVDLGGGNFLAFFEYRTKEEIEKILPKVENALEGEVSWEIMEAKQATEYIKNL